MDTTNIYVLKDPRTNEIRYVGKANNPSKRLRGHINRTLRNKRAGIRLNHKEQWIFSMLKEGVRPTLDVIAVVPLSIWQAYEQYAIAIYSLEHNLTNYAEGGECGTISNGAILPGYWRQAISKGRQGMTFTEEHKTNIANARARQIMPKWTEERRRKAQEHAQEWLVIYPNGEEVIVKNLSHFAREHNLSNSHLYSVAKGHRKQHKGFVVRGPI